LNEAIVIRLKNNHRDKVLKTHPGQQENQFLIKLAAEYFPAVCWLPVIYGSGTQNKFMKSGLMAWLIRQRFYLSDLEQTPLVRVLLLAVFAGPDQ